MRSLNNIHTTLGAALIALAIGLGMSLLFSFCQYCSERNRRREFRRSWTRNPAKNQSGSPTNTLTTAPTPWNWLAAPWQARLTRLEAEPFPSFISYYLSRIGRYGYAIAAVMLVFIVRWLLDPALEGSMPFSFFLAAVLFTARTQGIWETVLALALGFLMGIWFFTEPGSSFRLAGQHDWWAAAIYLLVGLGIVWFLKSEQTAWLRTLSSDIAALKQVRDLQPGRSLDAPPQHTRDLLASIVENAQDAILSTTGDGRILTWNAAAARLFGWSAAEIAGQPLADLLPPTRQPELQAILQQVSRGERLKPWQTILSGKEGLRLESSVTISPVKDRFGKPVGLSFIVHGRSPDLEPRSQPDGLPDGQ